MTVEAVIWDLGGVLTTSPFEAFGRYERSHGLPRDFIRSLNAANSDSNAWAKFERAEIDAAGFDCGFLQESSEAGHPVRGADVLPLVSGDVRPAMVDALKVCKHNFKVGCITNNMAQGHGSGMSRNHSGVSRIAEIMALFDAVVESSKTGVRKPDPRIYLMMCELLAVKPQSCIYLDDLGVNCKPAADLGMTTIKVVNQNQAINDLELATGLRLIEHAA